MSLDVDTEAHRNVMKDIARLRVVIQPETVCLAMPASGIVLLVKGLSTL